MNRWIKKLFFPLIGIGSLIWFLIRVIPKPSRASYPCMRAAAPLASSFVVYILGMFSTMVFFKKAGKYFKESRYVLYSLTLFLGILMAFGVQIQQSAPANANLTSTLEGPNQPMGTGVGVKPGRVAWIYNRDATNENYTNTTPNSYWYQDANTNQDVVTSMLSQGLQMMTGENSDAAAWNAIFHYYNLTHGKGDVGYTAGEKIVIKINLNGFNNGNPNRNINTSPQICYAVLNQLVNVVGVAQADIGIGEPNTRPGTFFNNCKTAFPNVIYWPGTGLPGSKNAVFFSSNGGWQTPLSAEAWNSKLPQAYLDAAYMINIPVFKKHHRAGISLGAKLHIGSVNSYAVGTHWCWHLSFPCPDATGEAVNGDYGVYRDFVDIMGHKDLGGKTILYLVDGIWGSVNWGHPPVKWQMPPFNNDWPNSLFLSQDPVAIESVGFDFLYYEFDENNPFEGGTPDGDRGPFPHFAGVDDYMRQAADSLNWPAGLVYDPEHDGTPLPRSLGAFEHWNNAIDKKYSRNLGLNQGIELASNVTTAVESNRPASAEGFSLDQNYPNPFNPTTTISYRLGASSDVNLTLYNAKGETVRTLVRGFHTAGSHEATWDGLMENGFPAPSGVYYYHMTARNEHQTFNQSNRMLLCK